MLIIFIMTLIVVKQRLDYCVPLSRFISSYKKTIRATFCTPLLSMKWPYK